ncbi:MAG TPA: GNAT family protein [Candidatus Elarobacter sp.]|nr:GNAT family protein [Candidatus Elarobacter sp.]
MLRPYRSTDDDARALVALANDPLVTRWMTAGFPYPYTLDDARAWLTIATADDPPNHYVIEAGGAFAGAIGIIPLAGEHRGVALFGYWLGRRFWAGGLATDAARTLARYALRERGIRRLEASVFAPNAASARVLEKAGFTLEGCKRAGYVDREGNVLDELVYARLASDPEP